MHFSPVPVQLDLVNLIPSFRLPGSARAPACYCLVYDRVGGWDNGGGLLGITKTSSGGRTAAETSLSRLAMKHM